MGRRPVDIPELWLSGFWWFWCFWWDVVSQANIDLHYGSHLFSDIRFVPCKRSKHLHTASTILVRPSYVLLEARPTLQRLHRSNPLAPENDAAVACTVCTE